LGGFVIMPDHYHAIFALRQDHTLSSIMATINRFAARQISTRLSQLQVAPTSGKRQFWERGYYDHAHRSRRDFRLQLDYIHNNPVRKQLTGSAEQWPFSTANPKWDHLIDWEWFR
jgi:putative transposase